MRQQRDDRDQQKDEKDHHGLNGGPLAFGGDRSQACSLGHKSRRCSCSVLLRRRTCGVPPPEAASPCPRRAARRRYHQRPAACVGDSPHRRAVSARRPRPRRGGQDRVEAAKTASRRHGPRRSGKVLSHAFRERKLSVSRRVASALTERVDKSAGLPPRPRAYPTDINEMRLFSCQNCGQMLYFENTRCERCGHRLGFVADEHQTLHALELAAPRRRRTPGSRSASRAAPSGSAPTRSTTSATGWSMRRPGGAMCAACRHNRVIPELGNAENRLAWRKIEHAKHRLFYTLFRLGLMRRRSTSRRRTIRWHSSSSPTIPNVEGQKVMTGHDDGVITIALSRGRRRRARAAAEDDGRALPHPARALPPRGRALLLGPARARRQQARGIAARCSATTSRITRRR